MDGGGDNDTDLGFQILRQYSLWKLLEDVWVYVEGYRKQLGVYALLSFIVSLFSMAPPYLIAKVIDNLTRQEYESMTMLLLAAGVTYVIYHVLDAYVVYHTSVLAERIYTDNRKRAFGILLKTQYTFFEKHPQGGVVARIDRGCKSLDTFVRMMFRVGVLQDLISTFMSLLFIFWLDSYIALGCLLSTIVYIYHFIFVKNKIIMYRNMYLSITEETVSRVWGYFSKIVVVKLLNMVDKIMPSLDQSMEDAINERKRLIFMDRYKTTVMRLFHVLSEVIILGIMASRLLNGLATLGDVLMMHKYYAKYTSHVKAVTNNYDIYLKTSSKIYRLSNTLKECNSLLQSEPEVPRQPNNDWKEISFNNVTFQYESKKDKARPALSNVSLSVKRGQKVAIVGRSGSGKSTLIKLLLRLYQPERGSVTIGDVSIHDILSSELYRMVKVVPQEDELMNCSLMENMRLATNRQINEEQVVQSLTLADAWDFVKELPNQLNAIIGPGGVNLSGGETQRVCIARALLDSPPIFVLDEATSSLDVMTENRIHQAMQKLSQDTTVIAVTHRLSSLYLFDHIIVMHKGELVGEGTHESLLRHNEHYQHLQQAAQAEGH